MTLEIDGAKDTTAYPANYNSCDLIRRKIWLATQISEMIKVRSLSLEDVSKIVVFPIEKIKEITLHQGLLIPLRELNKIRDKLVNFEGDYD